MGLWSFLAIAAVASSVAQMFRYYQKNNPQTSVDEEILKIMKGEIEALKERVKNLETIASSDLREKTKSIWSDYQVDDENGDEGSQNKKRERS